MISYIRGTLIHRGAGYIIVETGGIGYHILISASALAGMTELNTEVKVFTHMAAKEDGITLFGFSSQEEREIFLKLLAVSGVGPKAAMGFLAQLTPQEIITAVLSADVKTLSNAPGVGKKLAQRVILELKDKYTTEDAILLSPSMDVQETAGNAQLEAMDAMTALGYSRSEAAQAVRQVAEDGMSTEEILKAALKRMITY